MAFIKTHTTKSGVDGNYWRITDVQLSKTSDVAEITISLYINKDARTDGKSPIASKNFTVKASDMDLSKDLFQECYKVIKHAKTGGLSLVTTAAFFEDAIEG